MQEVSKFTFAGREIKLEQEHKDEITLMIDDYYIVSVERNAGIHRHMNVVSDILPTNRKGQVKKK